MTESLRYKGIEFLKAAVDFSGSDKLEKARRAYVVFLTVLLFIEFADVEIQSASLAVVTAKIQRPWVVTVGFWVLFLYSFIVYYLAAKKELALFTFKNSKTDPFFAQLNRMEFVRRIREVSGLNYPQPGSGLVKQHDNSVTNIQYEIEGIPEDVLSKVSGFDTATRTFSYTHDSADHAFFRRAVPLLRPALRFNYFVYVLPAHIGAGVIGLAIVEAIYALLG